MNPNNAHLVSQKKNSLKDIIPIFWVSHLPKSSPVFVNGSLEIQRSKMKQKTEKKNGAPFNSLNGCTEKRWRQSKFRRPSDGKKDQNLTFRAPKNQWKRWGVKWGPSTNLGFFMGVTAVKYHTLPIQGLFHPIFSLVFGPTSLKKNASSVLAAMRLLGAFYSVQKWSCWEYFGVFVRKQRNSPRLDGALVILVLFCAYLPPKKNCFTKKSNKKVAHTNYPQIGH